ncbi:MAG: P22 phage major capsid protein family protein [bacterium]
MPNTFLTTSKILRRSLPIFENNLVCGRFVNKEYSPQFAQTGGKIGDTVSVRRPPRYLTEEGELMIEQDVEESTVQITLDKQDHVAASITNRELLLDIDDFQERVLEPWVAALAAKYDQRVLGNYREFYNSVGAVGSVPNTLLTYLQAKAKLMDEAVPQNMLAVFLSPTMEITLVDALKGLFQQANAIADQYMKGQMGRAAGFTFYMDQQVATHTFGPLGGTPTVTGAGQSGSSLITGAWTAAAANRLKRGDIFTLANVNAVNPFSRESTGVLRQFVATADVDSDGAGAATIPLYPPIFASGKDQTVDALPANLAALTMVGTTNVLAKQGLAIHRDAITVASVDLEEVSGADMFGTLSDDQLGISLTLWRDGDIRSYKKLTRLDMLTGSKVTRPEAGCRIQSAQ